MTALNKFIVIVGAGLLLVFLTFGLKTALWEKSDVAEITAVSSPEASVSENNEEFFSGASENRVSPQKKQKIAAAESEAGKPEAAIPPKTEFSFSKPLLISSPAPAESPESVTASSTSAETTLPPLDEAGILRAIVKIECPAKDGVGKYIGSGFALKGDKVATAGHLIMDAGSGTCAVIFPREKRPIYYLRATAAENLEEIRRRHNEEGVDIAFLKLPPIDSYPEAKAVFPEYPFVPYPLCDNPKMTGDKILHFGYPSNYSGQNYLSFAEGEAVFYADIGGVREQLSEDNTYIFKTPIFSFTGDDSVFHPYMFSRASVFYGDSGGLAFNADKRCVAGAHRGGTIGGSAGENYSVFAVLGWGKIAGILAGL